MTVTKSINNFMSHLADRLNKLDNGKDIFPIGSAVVFASVVLTMNQMATFYALQVFNWNWVTAVTFTIKKHIIMFGLGIIACNIILLSSLLFFHKLQGGEEYKEFSNKQKLIYDILIILWVVISIGAMVFVKDYFG